MSVIHWTLQRQLDLLIMALMERLGCKGVYWSKGVLFKTQWTSLHCSTHEGT